MAEDQSITFANARGSVGADGVLASHAKLRAAVVPDVVQPASEHAQCQAAHEVGGELERVFHIDEYYACGGS